MNLTELLSIVAKHRGVSTAQMKSSSRNYHIFEARLIFSGIASLYSFRDYQVAWALHKHKSSICYYDKRRMELYKNDANFRENFHKTYKKVQYATQERI